LRTRSGQIKTRLDELITGKVYVGADATLIDRIKYFCYKYDPYTGATYRTTRYSPGFSSSSLS
jgi:hypothetical protein